MLNQLKKADIDERLIFILRSFFSEKATSSLPGDRDFLPKLAVDIQTAISEHRGQTLGVSLLQRFIMYGVNDPRLVSYYYDIFTKLGKADNDKNNKKLIRYLLAKIQVPTYHCFYPQQPTLFEAIQTQLQAWLNHIENKERDDDSNPPIKLQYYPPVIMKIFRLMLEARIIKTNKITLESIFGIFSRSVISPKDQKYRARYFKNGYEYRDADDIETVINLLDKMKKIAKKKREDILKK